MTKPQTTKQCPEGTHSFFLSQEGMKCIHCDYIKITKLTKKESDALEDFLDELQGTHNNRTEENWGTKLLTMEEAMSGRMP